MVCKNGPEQRDVGKEGGKKVPEKERGTLSLVPYQVVGGAVRDQNQGTAALTSQLLETLDMSRPFNVAL